MKSLLILLFAFTSIAVCAQEDQAEIRTFGGDQSEYGRDIIECANGDVVMLGMTTSDAANQSQAYIIRVDQDLNCIWSKSVGLFGVESPEKIIEMTNGDFVMVGTVLNTSNMSYDGWVVRLDAFGNVLWTRTIGDDSWNFLTSVVQLNDGTIAVGGYTENSRKETNFYWLDNDGTDIFSHTILGDGDYALIDMVADDNGNVFSAINFIPDFTGVEMGLILRVNGLNETMIENTVSQIQDVHLTDLEYRNDSVFVGGYYIYDDEFHHGGATWMFTSDLDLLWEDYMQFGGNYEVTGVSFGPNCLLINGWNDVFGAGSIDFMVIRRNLDGAWTAGPTFGSPMEEGSSGIIVHSNDRVYFLGQSLAYSEGDLDLYVGMLEDSEITYSYVLNTQYNQGCFTVDIEENPSPISLINFAQNELRFSGCDEKYIYEIRDLQGKILKQGYTDEVVNTSKWNTGIYFVSVVEKGISKKLFISQEQF